MEEIAPKQLPEQIFRTGCVEKNHDRFLIIDDRVYLMGASLKDMGAGLCAVTRMQASPEAVLGLLKWNEKNHPHPSAGRQGTG